MRTNLVIGAVCVAVAPFLMAPASADVFSNDFSANTNGFSGGTLTTAPSGEKYLALNQGTATLSLSGLTPYTSGTLQFLLYGISSVDGNGQNGGGPDPFTVTGPGLSFTTNIANYTNGNTQIFGPSPPNNAPGSGALATNTLGYSTCCGSAGGFNDSIYSITLSFSGALTTALSISFTDGTNEGVGNEFYGIDSVQVTTNTVSGVPGPIAGAGLPGLILAGGGLLGWLRRRKGAQTNAA